MKRRAEVSMLLIALCIAPIVSTTAIAESTLERAKRTGTIQMGFANEAPFSFTLADGTMTGADVEVARHVFRNLGVPAVEGVPVQFGALIPGLKAKRFDLIGAALFIRQARCEQVAFSEPNLRLASVMLVPRTNPRNIHSFDDVAANSAIKVAGILGGGGVIDAKAAGIKAEQITEYPDWTAALAALKAGRTDGVIMPSVNARRTANTAPDRYAELPDPWKLSVVEGKPLAFYAGYAFRPEDTDLLEAFNRELVKLVGTPEHLAMVAKFDITKAEVPVGVKTAELCKK